MAALKDYYNDDTTGGWDGGGLSIYSTTWEAQTFTASTTYSCGRVRVKLYKDSDVTSGHGNCTVGIYATDVSNKPTGSALVSASLLAYDFTATTSGTWYSFDFSTPLSIVSGTIYAIVVSFPGGNVNTPVKWKTEGDGTYAGGERFTSSNSGGSWTDPGSWDNSFETYLIGVVDEKFYSSNLVAISKDEVWYESTAETMSEFSDANGVLDADNPLMAVEAYQKLFIVNKTNLKIADFGNTKLTTTDIKPTDKVIPLKGDRITGGTSTAEMIVDYIDASDGSCNVYGFRTTTATFQNDETVTGTNDNGDISFTTSAAEIAPPHWYDWTVYSGDATTYGTMPTSSSLIALYRGRIVINDDHRPQAWYMFKVDDPWKVKYDYDNDGDLSAVVYANNLVGQFGDINTAFIAYKDDLFIFGGEHSIWILVGDPLGSGQLAQVSGKTGIWGSRAWCMDEQGNLYFFGENGIYKMPVSSSYSPPENISEMALPNLISDLALDKENHRVVLGYDPVRKGISICKTSLTDGDNTNYFFSLITNGFYPEEYPDSCGVFSAYHYPATNSAYRKFLIGCNDGYIREFDNSTTNDATTSSTAAIDSYFAVVKPLADNEDMEGKLIWMNGITAGGGTGGDFSDTDGVSYSLYSGDDAETTLEKMKAETDWTTATVYVVGDLVIYNSVEYICITAHTSNADGPPNEEPDTNTTDWLATQFATGTWTGTGKQTKNRVRMRGGWYGLKLKNDTASETWAINSIYINKEKAGKLR